MKEVKQGDCILQETRKNIYATEYTHAIYICCNCSKQSYSYNISLAEMHSYLIYVGNVIWQEGRYKRGKREALQH